jgi:hypothetical protein
MEPFNPSSPQVLIPFGVLALVSVATAVFLWLNRDGALKRKLFPYIASTHGVLFLSVFAAAGLPLESLFSFVPLIAVGVWLNVRMFRFCLACGATVRGGAFFSRPKYCPKCGEGLGK